MLDYKLKRMAKCIDNNDIIADKDIVIQDISIVRKHIKEFNNPKEHTCHLQILSLTSEGLLGALNRCRTCINKEQCNEEYVELYALEQESWENIWDSIKDRGRSFWD